ncbi:hypothetical protein OSTOST_19339, partial [Ostertagia ostertagi]
MRPDSKFITVAERKAALQAGRLEMSDGDNGATRGNGDRTRGSGDAREDPGRLRYLAEPLTGRAPGKGAENQNLQEEKNQVQWDRLANKKKSNISYKRPEIRLRYSLCQKENLQHVRFSSVQKQVHYSTFGSKKQRTVDQ